MTTHHEAFMQLAIAQAELARGTTGDNPWVGCIIVDAHGKVLGRGHTQGPGEDHAEVAAARAAEAAGARVAGATLYSTLEPCSFHGRTPACARAIATRGVARVVIGMRDPNPKVDGEGVRILRDAGVEVIASVLEREVRRQLGSWVVRHHPHDVRRRAAALPTASNRASVLAAIYAVDVALIESLLPPH